MGIAFNNAPVNTSIVGDFGILLKNDISGFIILGCTSIYTEIYLTQPLKAITDNFE